MFSVQQKRDIAEYVQRVLRDTKHPELPEGEIKFSLHVEGAESWSWADIRNNGSVTSPDVNPWNESQSGDFAKHAAQPRQPKKIVKTPKQFYEENATNVVDVPRPGHPKDPSGWAGVRRASEAKFIAKDVPCMPLWDAFDFAEKYHQAELREAETRRSLPIP